jgi:hypothetical protein
VVQPPLQVPLRRFHVAVLIQKFDRKSALSALGVAAVLADPQPELNDTIGVIATNDDWDPAIAPVFAQVIALPLPAGSSDSGLIATLTAGRNYTVRVVGVGKTVGESFVEVYQPPCRRRFSHG